MKVLHVITTLSRGGAEAMLAKLLSRSDRRRFEPMVVSLMEGGIFAEQIREAGVPVHALGMRRGLPDPFALVRLKRIVRQTSPDVVHAWMYHAGLAATMLRPRRPLILAIHHSLHDIKRERPLTRWIVQGLARTSRKAQRIVYCAAASRVQHEALGYDREHGVVIPNGFDCDVFRPMPEQRARLRAELDVAEGAFVVGHVGRYHPVKDHALLLVAFASVAARRREARLLMAGLGVDRDNAALREQIARLELEDKVQLLGERDDVPDVINTFDVLVNCSRSEAFPNVLGEALACGVPCVATDVGDSAHIVGGAGLVVPARDPGALAAAIERMAGMPPQDRIRLGAAARAHVTASFSLDHVIATYESLYDQVVAQGLRPPLPVPDHRTT